MAPIDRLIAIPVPGMDGAVVLVDKDTGEEFNVAERIEAAFVSGQCRGNRFWRVLGLAPQLVC